MHSPPTELPLPLPPADTRKPEVDLAAALAIAAEHFGPASGIRELPSERDRNFLLEFPGGERRVLRVASPDADPGVLALQNATLARLAGVVPAPRLLPAKDGGLEVTVALPGGDSLVRLFSWVEGVPLAEVKPHPPALLESAGELLARADRALADLHPDPGRWLDWDLQHAGAVIASRLPFVPSAGRAPVAKVRVLFEERLAPALAALPRQLIHNDGNDWNLLVRYENGAPRVSGLIDFGDIVAAPRVCEVAIAAAYAGLGKGRPEHAAAELFAGYQREWPLGEDEIALLPGLIQARLAVSVVTSAWRRRAGRSDPYLSISEQQAWESLELLQSRPLALQEAIFRVAAGLSAHRHQAAVVEHLRRVGGASASPVDVDLRREPVALLELGLLGAEVAQLDDENDPREVDELARRLERAAGARVSAGGYAEARAVYLTDAFAVPGSDRRERRTIHLGVDLFQPAGRPIFAPLAGTIHSLADNAAQGDYGPTIVLEHQTSEGIPFYSLYGHLSRISLIGKGAGQAVAQGEEIGTLGHIHENGGWAPHLHFQLMLDLLERRGDFPGVAAPSERAVWLGLCPDPNLLFGIPETSLAAPVPGDAELLARRARSLGRNLSLSYQQPLHLVRGRGAYLIDALGNAYLDTVNNVAHVGHGHPHVLRAARRQMALLNTNTRYLHEGILRYAEKLAATLPERLSVGFFVCSGSEANDLAWRMAKAATGRERALVLDGAYHGHTEALIDLSPYKFTGPGGEGRRPWVEVLPMPDAYRSPGRDFAGEAAEMVATLAVNGQAPAAVFAEPILSCGGQIDPPPGYLQALFTAVGTTGGVTIADEVQTGFGRVGSHFWAFEAHGLAAESGPDIVTMGKPIGNGHPLAAVFTTPEIAAAFAGGMEYFNTFGGNPVSCAIGEAVLEVIAGEGLQRNAADVGTYLAQGLRGLAESHPLIGDVRGRGLFLGVELVTDRESKAPATRQARYVRERMKERGILTSLDGPHDCVLKIKPPLVFSSADADRFIETLDAVLGEDLAAS